MVVGGHLEEDLLGGIARVFAIAEHAHGKVVYAGLDGMQNGVKCAQVAVARTFKQAGFDWFDSHGVASAQPFTAARC